MTSVAGSSNVLISMPAPSCPCASWPAPTRTPKWTHKSPTCRPMRPGARRSRFTSLSSPHRSPATPTHRPTSPRAAPCNAPTARRQQRAARADPSRCYAPSNTPPPSRVHLVGTRGRRGRPHPRLRPTRRPLRDRTHDHRASPATFRTRHPNPLTHISAGRYSWKHLGVTPRASLLRRIRSCWPGEVCAPAATETVGREVTGYVPGATSLIARRLGQRGAARVTGERAEPCYCD